MNHSELSDILEKITENDNYESALNVYELDFIEDMLECEGNPTEKQARVLEAILEKLEG